MPEQYKYALEIKSKALYQIACAIWPHLKELSFEAVKNNFLVFDPEGDGIMALYGPGATLEHIEKIEPALNVQFKTVYLK